MVLRLQALSNVLLKLPLLINMWTDDRERLIIYLDRGDFNDQTAHELVQVFASRF